MSARKSVMRSIKNVVNGYSSTQAMVRTATSNDPSGPTTSQMADIANHTYQMSEFHEVMEMIDRRLNDKGKNWRHIAKSLTLLDYLVRYGSDDVVLWAKDNLYIIKTLREFQFSDITGHDQGAIIRVKAKELTGLLKDDERLRQERELARERANDRRRRRGRGEESPVEEYDEALQLALEQSRLTAEEEERRRRNKSDDSIEKAIQLSLEEEEMRKKSTNLLDLDETPQPPQVYGFYQGQDQSQIIGYDMMGNPVYANQQSMNTGYLQNAYDQMAAQQQQQLLYEQQLAAQQAAQQQAAMEQQYYLQQQQLYQQQLAAQQQAMQQQQMMAMQTGTNNPFAMNNQNQQKPASAPEPVQQKPAVPEPAPQEPLKQTPTGIQRMNNQYSQLNALLATGTGIDTFGNTGETRIPAQHTKTGTFINSAGTGYKQETSSSVGNPFLGTQYTGIPSTGIMPSYTGYGFGNQPSASSNGSRTQGSSQQGGSLIDL